MTIQIDEDYQKQVEWSVYRVEDTDTVLARTPDEARTVVANHHGFAPGGLDYLALSKVVQVPNEEKVTIRYWSRLVSERTYHLLPEESTSNRRLLLRNLALPDEFDITMKVGDLIPLFDEPSFLYSTEW